MRISENIHMVPWWALIGPVIWFAGFLLLLSLPVCALMRLM